MHQSSIAFCFKYRYLFGDHPEPFWSGALNSNSVVCRDTNGCLHDIGSKDYCSGDCCGIENEVTLCKASFPFFTKVHDAVFLFLSILRL